MLLKFITLPLLELKFKKSLDKLSPILQHLPKKKRIHSVNVGRLLHKIGASDIGIYAGTLHDYLEKGGTIESISDHLEELKLSPQILHLIQSLSSDEKNTGLENEPLIHITKIIPNLPTDAKNLIILIKLSDRLDNLRKRLMIKGRVGNKYKCKSRDLVDYLTLQYDGDVKPMKKLLRKLWNPRLLGW